MNKSQLAILTDNERLLVLETTPDALAELDEDAVAELHDRIRRARNKYTGQYRRGASQQVSQSGGRGKAFGKNQRARDKAEVFEDALARVSRRLSVLAKHSADELKAERLAAAAAAKSGQKPDAGKPKKTSPKGRSDSTRTTRTERRRADTRAQGARRQAKRDSK
ncbi:MAG: hypothetical protein MUF33_14945 [Candidatus Nanopelagicales bacterium]|jgi:hypothetical protein|nr:hypothetical protein [Candidatus Nanopelagicales bacterium]MCU0299794.1 hypothetical protein [Candidatus Nanopelagicales bacterium]